MRGFSCWAGKALNGIWGLRPALGMALLTLAALAAAGCFGPPGGVLLLRDGAGGGVVIVGRDEGMVTLEAVPDEGYEFAGWGCTQEAACPDGLDGLAIPRAVFEAGAELALEATFERESGTATLELADAEGGMATADCGDRCTRERGWEARVEAMPDDGHRFRRWECEGGEACGMLDLTSPVARVVVSGNITLTPQYAAADEGAPLTLAGGADAVLTVLAACGAGCAAGEGWSATLSAAVPADQIVSGWSCVEVRGCPQGLEHAGVEARFVVDAPAGVAPELTKFEISSDRTVALEARGALCSSEGGCPQLVSGERDVLTVSAPDGLQLDYEWGILSGSAHLSIEQMQGNQATVAVAPELDEVIEGVVEVVSRNDDGVVVARGSLNVVAVPAALAAGIELSGDFGIGTVVIRCIGITGGVIRDGANHYVVTAFHGSQLDGCYSEFINAGTYTVRVGAEGSRRALEGVPWAADDVTRTAFLRIPDPGLAWVPSISSGGYRPGERVRFAGRRGVFGVSVSPDDTPPVVAIEMALSSSLRCQEQLFGIASFAVGEFPGVCPDAFQRFVLEGDELLTGTPALNIDGELAGVLVRREMDFASGLNYGLVAILGGLDDTDALLHGNSRCFVRGDFTSPDGQILTGVDIGVDDCSSQE